jgi:uncharacterized RDD family membrane protein YckC
MRPNSAETDATQPPAAGLIRRLAALFYDLFLLAALLMLAGLIALATARWLGFPAPGPGATWFQAYVGLVCYGFFGWFWTHGGQTLGMRAWRLRLQTLDGHAVTWGQALVRAALVLALLTVGLLWLGTRTGTGQGPGYSGLQFAVALLPCASCYVWILIDPRRRAWHDIASRSRVVLLPKRPPGGGRDRAEP